MGVKTLFPPSTVKPQSQYSIAANIANERTGAKKTGFGHLNGGDIAILRDSFSVSTWLLLGGALQVLLSFLFPRSYLAIPIVGILGWRIADAYLMHFGIKKNVWAEGVIKGKWSVGYPSDGETEIVHGKPGDNGPGAVMILGAKSNSPLGMFADGYKGVGVRFHDMLVQLEDKAEESGCKRSKKVMNPYHQTDLPLVMGMSTWVSAGERPTNNEFATISYWRSVEDIHNFGLSPIHREAWNWWNETISKHKHVGIMHEIFALPERQGWEGIYVNYQPTGLGMTTKAVESPEKGGQKLWINPIVDASRGVYRTSHGRMNRGDPEGKSNDSVIAKHPYTSAVLMQ
ncbi:hypothetical protein A1O7_04413 [Cladophialophora yegresii CBS 114405]|uniref:DUF4188 domain-containing protein n=1 Tax=Cladophialophora yegresii CBS 114405 TaxID=1182544 RepID=W9W6V5_9EURO|nr:uncharacterized protein A1O7_04413 [Cladophialophora yegresii CBS 114405]EXJ60261.1 hypothetical protein A1O7_04413 [Cladophialophora yegresii CBS 114405]